MLFFNTNLKDKDIPADFERKLCEKVGEVLNKPIEVSNVDKVKVVVARVCLLCAKAQHYRLTLSLQRFFVLLIFRVYKVHQLCA